MAEPRERRACFAAELAVVQASLLAMSKELLVRIAGDSIASDEHSARTLQQAGSLAADAIRVLEAGDADGGKERLIEVIECYLAAHRRRTPRDLIAREVDAEIGRRRSSGPAASRSMRK